MVIQSQRIAIELNVNWTRIEQELQQAAQQNWLEHVNKQCYEGNWSVTPLRCKAEFIDSHPIMQAYNIQNGADWVDLPVLEQLPEIKRLITAVPEDIKSARLMLLGPGAQIKPHCDYGLSIEHGEARLHIPLQTNDQLVFNSNGENLKMKPGELWYINADLPHSVHNAGDRARINLVLDCIASDWLKKKLH